MKGIVGIENKKGKLRLRLPRSVATDSARYLSTGMDATLDNHRKAQRVALEIEEDIRAGQFDLSFERYLGQFKTQPQKIVRGTDLGELWGRYCQYMKPQLAVTTYQRDYTRKYANHIQRLPTRDLRKAIAIRDHLVATLSADTAKRVLTYINACCSWGVSSGLVSHNPFEGMAKSIKVAKAGADIDPFTLAEREAILKAFSEHPQHKHYLPFVRFLFLTGCRPGEAIALQWQHISTDCSQITFSESFDSGLKVRKDTKTHQTRKFPCNQVLRGLLLSIKPKDYQPDGLVFASPTGLPINASKFASQVWKGCKSGQKTYQGIVGQLVRDGFLKRYRCPYNCRHTFITMAIEAGVPITQVAKWVGNSPEVILKHYAGILNQAEVPIT
ncbi:site-specific integrase [Scytonema sp. PCC 10023]|uniref:site-specific integrase n=1 Tax=Scytonema sp. PCC 10023 TaxID=1680591 RepID=UPI0039C5EBA3